MSEEKKQGNYISQAWLVILLALVYGGGLAGVQTVLGPRIAENKKNETYSVIPHLVEGAVKEQVQELEVTAETGRLSRVYKALSADGAHKGWVLPASGQGFADRIEVLIGLNAELSVITGVYVLAQKETPGLGDFIRGENFCGQYRGKTTAKALVVVKAGASADNEIDALTGATISTQAVTDIVNKAVKNLRKPLLELKEK